MSNLTKENLSGRAVSHVTKPTSNSRVEPKATLSVAATNKTKLTPSIDQARKSRKFRLIWLSPAPGSSFTNKKLMRMTHAQPP